MPSKRIKVAHLVALDTIGGVERLYCDYLRMSYSDFQNVTISDRSHIHSELAEEVNAYSEQVYSVKYYHSLRLPKKPSFLRHRNLKRLLSQIAPEILVVWNKIEGIDLSLCPSSTKVIYYEHGAGWRCDDKKAATAFLSKVDGVICNSKAALEVIRYNWSYSKDNAVVIHNPLLNKFKLSSTHASCDKLPHSPFRLGLAGRLVSVKGVTTALHALKILLDKNFPVILSIAGVGPDEQQLKALTKELCIEGAVNFLGLQSQIEQFYLDIDCLLCPSLREPFGLVALEAMAFGCPVIASDVDGLADVVENNITGYTIPVSLGLEEYQQMGGNIQGLPPIIFDASANKLGPPKAVSPDSMANAICELILNTADYSRMSHAARIRSHSLFSPETYFDRFKSVLHAVSEQNI
ncbi:glycosyltransferase family 4 protein [Hahella sp. HN01]|uniref:glycosyltransferase family 4 protein n=1 Tax=unclassified Hahella TaxID=2624107 RepID=UPI001C1F0DAB|nr:glycosyltransferase family 4 protein [Hahella sp. HN01]MBU6951598.1 glycosyltransferase family 4 protein [Hahella sp. HN01]